MTLMLWTKHCEVLDSNQRFGGLRIIRIMVCWVDLRKRPRVRLYGPNEVLANIILFNPKFSIVCMGIK